MVSATQNNLVKLLFLNCIIVSFIFVTASALSGYTMNVREQSLLSRLTVLEEDIYEFETIDLESENVTFEVYSIIPLISGVNHDLKNYARQNMIRQSFYEKQDEKLVSLSVLYMKTIKQVLKDRLLIQLFCTYDSASCDYENFVLSYLMKKYSDKLIVLYFDGDSTHPLIRMIKDKYVVENFPFMIIDDELVYGFLNAQELEKVILQYVSESA
ncbi:MAG: hypothetical protein GON13_01730 [Nanoarchaeota archaeon]|nr:hypothetical protein [Nanoarchaeota archaeon]